MLGALLGVGASLLGGAMQAGSAKKAAKAQEAAANRQMDFAEKVYNEQKQTLAPYVQSGTVANAALNYKLGLGEAPTIGGQPLSITTIPGTSTGRNALAGNHAAFAASLGMSPGVVGGATTTPTTYQTADGKTFSSLQEAQAWANANPSGGQTYTGENQYSVTPSEFTADPGYQYRLKQGLDSVQSSAAARGMLNSGSTMNAVGAEAQGQASQEYNNWYNRYWGETTDYLNRLTGQSNSGQNAALGQASAAGNMGNTTYNALGSVGDAKSAGAVATGNAWASGIENALGAWKYGQTTAGNTSLAPASSIRPQARPW